MTRPRYHELADVDHDPPPHAAMDRASSDGRPMMVPGDRGRGPTLRSLAVLAVAAFASIATSASPPTLEGRIIGEVVLGGGETTERELQVHLDPAAGGATAGSIKLTFQSASGLQTGFTNDATIAFVSASSANGSFEPSETSVVGGCFEGCDLTYRIGISTDPGVLPGSVLRYEVNVRLQYDYNAGPLEPSMLSLALDGEATGPVVPLWWFLAGVLALVGGIALGWIARRELGPDRQLWPARGLVVLSVGMIGWMVVLGNLNLVDYRGLAELGPSPLRLLAVVDPWSTVLLATLGWGVWRGIRRWSADGGWLLGLAAIAMVGLGGLWLAGVSTMDPVVQPVLLTIPFVLLGGLGGTVIGLAWGRRDWVNNDRHWAALAVLSHGVVIAGFGFLAEQSLVKPFTQAPFLLALLPAALVAMAFWRWLRGSRRWLILFDLVIAAAGLLGLLLWSSLSTSFGPRRFEIEDVATYVAVAAAVVAVVTSFHTMSPHPGSDPTGTPDVDVDTIAPVRQAKSAVDVPPTT